MSEIITPSPDLSNQEFDYQEVKKRAGRGVAALISRTFAIQVISFIATFSLTIFLDPSIYGIFFLVSAVINFLSYFSDIGLAAALVQKKKELSREDLVTTFTIQQLLVGFILVLLFVFTPYIRHTYNLNSAGVYLLWSLAISLFLSSLKTIPSVLLERKLHFEKLIIPQIAETLVFNLTAVYFAWKGYGLNTFTIAVLARGITGTVLMYIVAPWKMGVGISKSSLHHLLRFGLPFQANTFLAVFKDDGMTMVLGKVVGSQGLGYLGWGSRWSGLPLRIFMDNITKVAFPAFARLQHDEKKLVQAIEVTLKYLALATFPILIGMGFLAQPLVNIIPKYAKWAPALFPLYVYLYNSAWACLSTVLTNTLNALGKIKSTFKLMIMWTTLTWATMPVLGIKYGYLGVSLAVALIATSSIFTLVMVKRLLPVSYLHSLAKPLIINLVFAVILFFLRSFTHNYLEVIIVIIISGIAYLGLVFFLEGKDIFTKAKTLLQPNG